MNKLMKKTWLKMTFFCTTVTGVIFVVLSVIFLFLYHQNVMQNFRNSFNNAAESAISHLYASNVISSEWLGNLQNNAGVNIFIYDNQHLLYIQNYHENSLEDSLDEIRQYADENYDMRAKSAYLPGSQIQFDYICHHEKYLAAIANIPKRNGSLCLIILSAYRNANTIFLRFLIYTILIDLLAVLLLFLFSGIYTRKILTPVEENQKRQMLFVASASHELKTPLAVLLSGIEALEVTESREEQLHFTGILKKEIRGMKLLVEEMLLLSKADAHAVKIIKEQVPVSKILISLFEKYQTLITKKGLSLQLSIDEEVLVSLPTDSHPGDHKLTGPKETETILADQTQVEHILSILLDNAIAYTKTGSITLSYHTAAACFCVSDTGIGISKDAEPHIFDCFYQEDSSHNKKDHFGLGLPIAQKIAESFGGKIWYQKGNPAGSKFFLSI